MPRAAKQRPAATAPRHPDPVKAGEEARGLPAGWTRTTLGEILPLKYGKARTPGFGYVREATATYGSNGAFGTFNRALTTKPAIIVGRKGAAGAVHYSPEPCWPIDTAFYTEEDEKAFLPFFRYLLESLQLVALDRSTAIPSLSRDDYDAKIICHPESVTEQRRIVAEIEKQFTRLEAGVAALKRVQANLSRYRAAVLKAACEGKLVPTEAELARGQKYETGEELLKRILAERRKKWAGKGKYKEPAALDTANLPKLPEGWTWATLDSLIREPLRNGHSAKGTGTPTGLRVFTLSAVTEGDFSERNTKLSVAKPEKVATLWAESGDIYVERSNTPELVGIARLYKGAARFAFIPDLFIRVRVASPVSERYIEICLLSERGRAFFRSRAQGISGTMPKIDQETVECAPIPVPPLSEQKRIVAEVERRLSVVEELSALVTANLHRATRLRQAVLQKAFEGKLVSRAQTPAPAVSYVAQVQQKCGKGPNRHFYRAVLSAEIVHQLHNEPTFGRIKHQKILHLCEHIAQLEEIEGQYHREAAGPLDNRLIFTNETELKKQKWYQVVPREQFGHAYEPMANAGGHRKYLERYWPDKLPLIRRLIEMMRGWDTEGCEIFCTAYAAWNDLILWGREPTEAAILGEILDHWHDSKRRIQTERWCKAIAWMRKEGFTPTGFGRPTSKGTCNSTTT